MGGSAGYYVRFRDIPEEEGGPVQKYIAILQFDSQEKALEAAVQYRNETAREYGIDPEPSGKRPAHSDDVREKMSESHNRMGLRGLRLTLSNSKGTFYPIFKALWSEEGRQQRVTRSTVQRGIWNTVEELVPYLKEHIHEYTPEEELLRVGAEGAAQCLQEICRSAAPNSKKRKRLESLFEKWARENRKDRELLGGRADLDRSE
jgi:hypothetical protein